MKPGIIRVDIDGTSYPCRLTMGAMLRFKRETGKEVAQMEDGNVSDLLTLLWCCVASASSAEKIPFHYGLEEFCDLLGPEEVERMQEALHPDSSDGEVGGEKKA